MDKKATIVLIGESLFDLYITLFAPSFLVVRRSGQ